jgi:hypothetical protein
LGRKGRKKKQDLPLADHEAALLQMDETIRVMNATFSG